MCDPLPITPTVQMAIQIITKGNCKPNNIKFLSMVGVHVGARGCEIIHDCTIKQQLL